MVLHLDIPVHQELVVRLQLSLDLLVLESLVLEVQMHVSDVLGKGLFNLSHSESPDATRVIDFWDCVERDVFGQFGF
jgi:hypothetical protein